MDVVQFWIFGGIFCGFEGFESKMMAEIAFYRSIILIVFSCKSGLKFVSLQLVTNKTIFVTKPIYLVTLRSHGCYRYYVAIKYRGLCKNNT